MSDLAALLDDPDAGDLVWLDLNATGLGLAAIDLLAERASGLRHLEFDGNPEGTPTGWWTDGGDGLFATGGTVPRRRSWGSHERLDLPVFRCPIVVPQLYYPYPDL